MSLIDQLVIKRERHHHHRPRRVAACITIALLVTLALEATHSLSRSSPLSYEELRRISPRSELVSVNFGRDGEGELRTLSGEDEETSRPTFADSDDISLAYSPLAGLAPRTSKEIYLLEDKDYPKSLFEDYPRRVGQVSGIATLPSNDVAIFHRSDRQWTGDTFNQTSMRIEASKQGNLIGNDTILIIDRENGGSITSFGSNLFYMPHSIASDHEGNLWVSDVARHQVMRLPIASVRESIIQQQLLDSALANGSHFSTATRRQIWPDIILGEAFVPGDDQIHFCQPSEIAVSSNGMLIFVADGYCNQRVMVFTGAGSFVKSFGESQNLSVVHSLALIEEKNLICVADRENGRILCFHAGLDGDYDRLGQLIHLVEYPLGRVFAITPLSENHLLVSSNQLGTNRYDLTILNPFKNELKLVWISTDLLEPHSLASTRDRQSAYAADISKDAYKKVFKFDIIKRRN